MFSLCQESVSSRSPLVMLHGHIDGFVWVDVVTCTLVRVLAWRPSLEVVALISMTINPLGSHNRGVSCSILEGT